jgi:phosphoglucosamine mutase
MVMKLWHENRQPMYEMSLRNGEVHGKYVSWFENGQTKSEGYFTDGVKNGMFKEWDEKGNVVTGDQILSLIASHTPGITKIALTKMVNPGIVEALKDKNIDVIETDVGDKYITQALKEERILIGGEDSGHMIFKSRWPIGDGIIRALELLNTLEERRLTLHEAIKPFKPYPSILLNFKNIDGSVLNDRDFLNQLELIKSGFNSSSKVFLRKSGTEALVRLYASHKDETILNTFKDQAIQLFQGFGGVL